MMPLELPARYNLSFTAASLRPELARVVAEYYLDLGNWDLAREKLLADNALQARRSKSSARMVLEFRRRVAELTHDQTVLLARSTGEDRTAMAWLAVLKYTAFVFDFAAETLRDKLAARDTVLRRSDYAAFVDAKSPAQPQLPALAESTRAKLREVVLLMLTQADILVPGSELGTIQRPVLSPAALQAIRADDSRWLAGFLVPYAEIARV